MSRHPRCRIKAYSGALSVKCSSKAWQSFEEHHGRGLLIDGPVPTFRLGHGLAHARGDRNGQPHNSNPRRNNRGPGKTAGWFTKYREQYKECTETKTAIMERPLFSEERRKSDCLELSGVSRAAEGLSDVRSLFAQRFPPRFQLSNGPERKSFINR